MSSHTANHWQSPSDPDKAHSLEASPPPVSYLLLLIHCRFAEWAKQYGEIFSLKLGPGTTIVITSPRLIKQLIDKKSSIYSFRPPSYVGNGIIANNDHILLMQYSERWRTARKLIHQYFMEKMVLEKHLAVVDAEAVQMLRDFVVNPTEHMRHPKRFSNSVIMSLGELSCCLRSRVEASDNSPVYGVRTPNNETDHMKRLYHLMEIWSKVMEPGNAPPVDAMPILKFVPEKLLGMWRSRAQSVNVEMNKLYDEWLGYVVGRRETSGSHDCFMDRVLDQEEKIRFDKHAIYFLCGTLMEGGSDTTSSIIIAFIHAMTKWPAIQKRAQEQVDKVVGDDRSPTWADYSRLPYVAACVKEAMRWRPVAPLGFPHAVGEDDWIDGMLVPKGSEIIINAFGMHHDEKSFPNHDVFDPDHYEGFTALAAELASGDYENRDHYGYGSGRRICPGIHLAERNLFLAIAKLLWAFNIDAGTDESGKHIAPDVSNETGYSSGFLVCADPYSCKITPRSEARRATILKEFEVAQSDVFSKYETPKA